jgi:hypothetical protein
MIEECCKDLPSVETEKGLEFLSGCLSMLSSSSGSSCRGMALSRALEEIRTLTQDELQKAVDLMIAMFTETDDHCLQQNIAGILLFQLSPDIDARLLNAVESSNGKIAPFVKAYILGIMELSGKYTVCSK